MRCGNIHNARKKAGVGIMAMFMLSEQFTLCVKATEISHKDGYVFAWNGENVVAIFKASELIGCWLEGSVSDNG